MIKNWDFHDLHMDFSSMYSGSDHPSDIDMVYIGKQNTLIIGEIKHESGSLKNGQRRLLEKFVNNWKWSAFAIYITHDKLYQNGDREVNVADCFVREIYTKSERKWRHPKRMVTVKEIIKHYSER